MLKPMINASEKSATSRRRNIAALHILPTRRNRITHRRKISNTGRTDKRSHWFTHVMQQLWINDRPQAYNPIAPKGFNLIGS
jgi:hypothetical protein